MKRTILLVVASLFLNGVAAKSVQGNLGDDLVLIFSQEEASDLGRQGIYNYSINSRLKSIGFMHNTPLTTTTHFGFGMMFGGIEIELESQSSIIQLRGSDIDIDSLLGVNVKLKFADITPYANLVYYIENRKKQLSFSANAGLRLLRLSSISVSLDGEIGNLLKQNNSVISRLQEEFRQSLDEYYLEPVMQMQLNFAFN